MVCDAGRVVDGKFSQPTKDLLAAQAGHRCSAPWCGKTTSAASGSRSSGVSNTGEAAHIHGRTKLVARHDTAMSDEALAAPDNGLWLCEYDAKLIDNDSRLYTVPLLRQWKQQRIVTAQREQAQGSGTAEASLFAHTITRSGSSVDSLSAADVQDFLAAVGMVRSWGSDAKNFTGTLLTELAYNARLHAGARELSITSAPGEVSLAYLEGRDPFGVDDLTTASGGRGGRGFLGVWNRDWNERFHLMSRLEGHSRIWTVRDLAKKPIDGAPCTARVSRPREIDPAMFIDCDVVHIVLTRQMAFSDAAMLFERIREITLRLSVLVTSPLDHDIELLEYWIKDREVEELTVKRWQNGALISARPVT